MSSIKTLTSEYKAWQSMRQRCHNVNNSQYHLYGGRGILVCKEWMVFDVFFGDMGKKPSKIHQIDRVDNNKGYCKENCRWVIPKINAQNRRNRKGAMLLGVRRGKNIKRGTQRYFSEIMIEKISYYLGMFDTEIEAHKEYLKIYKEWFGKMPLMGEGKCLQHGMD